MNVLTYGIALICGLLAGYIDFHSSEIQPTLLIVVLTTFFYGYFRPSHAWRWTVCITIGIPLFHLIANMFGMHEAFPPEPNVWATLFAFIPAILSTYIGVAIRTYIHPHYKRRLSK